MRVVKGLVGLGLLSILVGCGGPAASQRDPALIGSWMGTSPHQPGEVAMELVSDGTFTWSAGDRFGTWRTEGTRLIFDFAADGGFCADGTLEWDYGIDGDQLTSDTVDSSCSGVAIWPETPDWTFERH